MYFDYYVYCVLCLFLCLLCLFLCFMFILMFIPCQRNNSNLSQLKLESVFKTENYRDFPVIRVENSIPNMVFYFRHFENKLMFILSLMINIDRMNKELSSKIT